MPASPATTAAERRALRWEILLVLAITFGASGARAALRLIEALARPERLDRQTTTLNGAQSALWWLDPAFQLISTGVLCAWGGLAMFLLLRHVPAAVAPLRPSPAGTPIRRHPLRPRRADILPGILLAAAIGLPGLAFYLASLHLGLSKHVDAAGISAALGSGPGGHWYTLPLVILNAWANGFAEELVVVAWLCTRMRQLRVPWGWVFAASAVLRGSYHLYQGPSAGVGNVVMGLVFVWWYRRTGRVWPLIVAHGLIDTVAFAGSGLLGPVGG
ncbi:CPBP family intramembrane glutamic endopeptidase [Corynebacterium heidelbergense]|uniref:CPBP family intramembrane metalloprotease n=1 Tax=Corynebacterium heidelbergense TaxID=2055947 RepID=A0A364V7B3_9CORY|nr:type II CAAX endopeptidase family protein [Corynebacterium heidelbergense]RAV32532.1 CPBP family intramembrane metalloprotease [Corynebacterium heidelbergense]WCZ35697.1 CAAX amino terminal protease self- immunity [Corynebacterium heidelbergense]